MNVTILLNEPFPKGMAATNRVISYSKGLLENDVEVNVICLKPHEIEDETIRNSNSEGIYYGIKFNYIDGTTIWQNNKFIKNILMIKITLNSILKIYRLNKTNKIFAFLLVSNNPFHILIFGLTSYVLKIKYIQEKSEFPFVLNYKSNFGKIYAWIYTTFIYKLFDGIFVMTNPLKKYFEKRISKNAKIEVVPMTVEWERFNNCSDERPVPYPYIAYCGYMGGNKDGVDILIEAFNKINKMFPEYVLVLIGYAENEEISRLKELVQNLNIEDRVIFTGKIDRDEMPKYLCNADVLALARPTSLQSTGGFPTKLGEYLATGKPVIVTKVGEIPTYLSDGDNAFLVEPDNVDLFAKKLEYVLAHINIAQKVGIKGKELVKTIFDYRYQSKILLNFIKSI
jgi:glycosyltransferase involved in cell wall biosynthesis